MHFDASDGFLDALRLLACAREDGDVEAQWEKGIGVTICVEIQTDPIHPMYMN